MADETQVPQAEVGPAKATRAPAKPTKGERVTALKMQLAQAVEELDDAKKARADAEVIVRQRAKDIEKIKSDLIDALS